MTPQSEPQLSEVQPGIAGAMPNGNHFTGSNHLTDDQFGELLVRSQGDTSPEMLLAEAHLLTCEKCAAELASMHEAVAFFREASNAYANSELRRMPRWVMPERRTFSRLTFSNGFAPAYWVAAAAMLLAAVLPLQLLRWHREQMPPAVAAVAMASASQAEVSTQSDAVLLEDVNRDISAKVPSSMQALAVPTEGVVATEGGVSTENAVSAPVSTQRKD